MINIDNSIHIMDNVIELDLDKILTKSLTELIKDICQYTDSVFKEWSQYTDYGIGLLYFNNQEVKIYWEDFPNILSFEFKSKIDADIFLKKIIMA